MKKITGSGIVLICMLCLALCLCAGCAGQSSGGNVKITSADGTVICEAPDAWEDVAGQLSGEAVLEAANVGDDEYLAVIAEPRADFDGDMNLQGYNKVVIDNIKSAAKDVRAVSEEKTEQNGNAAVLTRLDASVEGTALTYFVCAEEWPEHYVQVVAWTTAEQADEREDELLGVIRSVKQAK